MGYEVTLNDLLMQSLNSVFLRAHPNRELRAYGFFAHKLRKEWAAPATADGAGVHQPKGEEKHSLFLVVETKRGAEFKIKALRQIGLECSNFVFAKQRPHFLGLVVIASDIHITYYVHLIVSQGIPSSAVPTTLVDDEPTASTRPKSTSFISILLAEGTATKDDDKLPRLMSALAWAGLHAPLVHQVDVVPETTIKCKRPDGQQSVRITSACDKNDWVKVYPHSSARRWEINLLKIPGATLVVDTPLLKVMRYPNIEGEVCPSIMTPALFLKAAEQLLDLHCITRYAHGDVRLDNLVVNTEQNTVQWIDFDFASNIDQPRCYPLNWVITLPDARRHRAAVAGNLILPKHDVFSFRSLLELYQPLSKEVHDWFAPSESDDDTEVDLLALIDRLKAFPSDMQLKSLVRRSAKIGTGTP